MRAEQLVARWRQAIPQAVTKREGPRIPMIGERYRDERGRMITVTASSYREVTFERDFYPEPCVVPLWQFERQFKRVVV